MPLLIRQQAPFFQAKAVMKGSFVEEFNLNQLRGSYIVFFFYPFNFTFVCPTEIHAFQDKLSEFQERKCEVVGCSVDSHYSHYAWLRMPRAQGGIQGVEYPLVSDLNKSISKAYGVLNEEEGVAYRGLFLIDRCGIVRHQMVNDPSLGRCVDEVLRVLDGLIFSEKHGEVCPANWKAGAYGMVPSEEGIERYFAKMASGK